MTKISVTGSKKYLDRVIDELHDLELMDIDQYEGEFDTGEPNEEAEKLSELLVDIRSVLSKLPETEPEKETTTIQAIQENLPEITDELDGHEAQEEQLKRQIEGIKEQKKFFKKLRGSGLTAEDLKESETLNVFTGRLDKDSFLKEIRNDRFEIFEGDSATAVIYSEKYAEQTEQAIQNNSKKQFTVPDTELHGTCENIYNNLEQKRDQLETQIESVESQKRELAEKWSGKLNYIEDFLTQKIEKAEAPINFATTDRTFMAWGWIPEEKFEILEERLAEASEGKIHVQREELEEDEEPPVKHENNRAVQPFESLTDLVSVPRYNELDPSVVLLLTFPLFFGFMIGDAGYGLTTLAVFYAGAKMFPKGKEIFHSLMYASVATIIFGLAFGDAFGYVIFGHHSELAAATGIQLFEQIPILWHRAEHLGQVFTISALIGLVHVNLGYGIGFYNEYIKHGLKEAFLEKGSWYVLQAGAALAFLVSPTAGLPVMILGFLLIFLGEGVEGMVEIPSLLANILSYLRIFGVSVAAVALAAVVNSIASTAYGAGGLVGIVLGTLILVGGHIFNTFIKIMEGFLQGIRLHYVEMFGKFYEGGGKKYAPFGAQEP
ncbi:V-type ATP synthase subunit I [Candidatus Nanohalobium constans]|uniref:A-type ATP synthase subunit I n=1 Tax=Candidatus Nanohalobium constans TaxID=2565781 RepID=A0A5Q0UHP3_9ARCH|nr:V-type ATP synthase subunit I [Candidatus Nanohalobium constans]QGA80720.1 V/A-type H+/Na+-transporting ATPase subunit I [Candidatus Nanohalobium constans]